MDTISLHTNDLRICAKQLKAGQRVLLSGTVYTARDAAHKRLSEMIQSGLILPFPLKDACIYYAGPTPAPVGMVIGSCGPTTSGRMDSYTPLLLENGLVGMIGKGERNETVINAIKQFGAVYFCAIGGAGALAAKCVTACEEIAFKDLGCESIKRLSVNDFSLFVGMDSHGGNLFQRNI